MERQTDRKRNVYGKVLTQEETETEKLQRHHYPKSEYLQTESAKIT